MALSLSPSSSSFSISTLEKYDVFLSFSGVDKSETDFVIQLSSALHSGRIKSVSKYHLADISMTKAEEEEYPESLKLAIEKSKLSVIVFSKDYASSTWCLEELLHILKCKEKNRHTVVPVFYDIGPSDLQNQQGSYAAAFSAHADNFKHKPDTVRQWRSALRQVAELSGVFYTPQIRSESKFVKAIVRDIATNVYCIIKGLVGVVQRIVEIEKLLDIGSDDIRVVGITGMGGMGKTTLAEAVYCRLSYQFEGFCFLANVREESRKSGSFSSRRKLVAEIFMEKGPSAGTPTRGKARQQSKKALLVLDDVDHYVLFQVLAREKYNRFGAGSRIIVTARDKELLSRVADAVYSVEPLNQNEALRLFSINAFGNDFPATDYFKMSRMIVDYLHGIPLAIKSVGSFLYSKSKGEWESAIAELRNNSHRPAAQEMLLMSFYSLDEEVKSAFLDIACILKGEDRDLVEQLISPTIIDELINKSLVTINHDQRLRMHDLVQEGGWEMVRRESIKEPGKRSRLCNLNDVYRVLQTNTGTGRIEGISLEASGMYVILTPAAFEKMHNLRLLKLKSHGEESEHGNVVLRKGLHDLPSSLKYLHWDGFPLQCLPSNFNPENLVGLVITNSQITTLPWHRVQNLRNLKYLDLSHSKKLTKIPDFYDQAPNLECILLQFCTSLAQVPSSLQCLEKLRLLSLRGCSSIKEFPMLPRNIRSLDLSSTSIEQVPSIEHLPYLETLNVENCERLEIDVKDAKFRRIRLLCEKDEKEIFGVITQDVGKFSEKTDVVTEGVISLGHKPAEAGSKPDVRDARVEKEDVKKRFHHITLDVGESSEIEEEEEDDDDDDDDPIFDYELGTHIFKPAESSEGLDVHGADSKEAEDGDSNPNENPKTEPTYSCSCLTFLSLVVDVFEHVLGRKDGSDPHQEGRLRAPDKVLQGIMTELGEHNQRISQHLRTVMSTSHGCFSSPETTSNSIEKKLRETPEEVMDSLCSQIIELREQNNAIMRNLRALVPTTPDDETVGLFPESTPPLFASNVNDPFKDVIVGEQQVEVPEEVIHSLRSHLTELRGHNKQMLQLLHVAMSHSPTPTASR